MFPQVQLPQRLLVAREAAELLRCSEWWLKSQARQRLIPFTWVAGSYRWSAEQVEQIKQQLAVPALAAPVQVVAARQRTQGTTAGEVRVLRLKPRTPPRARAANHQAA
jgi:hypothetical protein